VYPIAPGTLAAMDATDTLITETTRLRLRELQPGDAQFIYDLLHEPGWLRFIGNKTVHDLDGARAYIERQHVSYEANGFGLWVMERREDGAPVGLSGLLKRDTLDDVDIGFATSERYQGQGYGEEAAAAVMAIARSRFALRRVVAIVSQQNEPSAALLGKLGFRFERLIPWAATGEDLRLFAAG
jgi:RimJ/RimL family protein N-acetyltransferase